MNAIIVISRLLIGALFIFSGFVKAIDPVGSQIKFEDYFEAMGLTALSPYALTLALLMTAAEVLLGFMLFLNAFPKLAMYGSIVLMVVFTPLTLWLAVSNAVSDCGCFGDAVKMTNWQTFWKNIVIDGFLLVLFASRKQIRSRITPLKQVGITAFIAFIAFGFQYYNLQNLPIIDFRPYKDGNNIADLMKTPEGAPKDVYKTSLFYKNIKTGESKEFTLENAPYTDSLAWAYDTTINVLISKGYKPPIHDFKITMIDGTDITEQVLSDPTPVLVVVSYDLLSANLKNTADLYRLQQYATSKKIGFVCFTASGEADINSVKAQYPEGMPFFNADRKVLRTIMRSNPGVMLLKKGTVVKKWHHKNIPDTDELDDLLK